MSNSSTPQHKGFGAVDTVHGSGKPISEKIAMEFPSLTPPAGAAAPTETLDASRAAVEGQLPNNNAEDEEAVEKYLAALLGRYSATAATESNNSPTLPPAQDGSAATSTGLPQPGQGLTGKQSAATPIEPDKTARDRRKTPRPEMQADMSAMREIANLVAKGAIATHQHGQMIKAAYNHLLMAGVAMAASFVLVHLGNAATPATLALALAGLAISGFWSLRYLRLTRTLSTEMVRNPSPPVEPQTATAPSLSDTQAMA